MRFLRVALLTSLLVLFSASASWAASRAEPALAAALDTFERALPHLADPTSGVDLMTYRAALSFGRFQSAYWGGSIALSVREGSDDTDGCERFAALTLMPPSDGTITLVLCPQFFTPGADELRVLTILHEMVHVVAGPDECRAMAFAAQVQQTAQGRWTPVDAYWQANSCDRSAFSLP
jgi:hypothetical protein